MPEIDFAFCYKSPIMLSITRVLDSVLYYKSRWTNYAVNYRVIDSVLYYKSRWTKPDIKHS